MTSFEPLSGMQPVEPMSARHVDSLASPTSGSSCTAKVDPYPGLNSFEDTKESAALFAGRDRDSEALLNLVLSEQTTVLFSRSGLGKSSLLKAGVFAPLRVRGFFPIYGRLTQNQEGPIASVIECTMAASERAKSTGLVVRGTPVVTSLWALFSSIELLQRDEVDGELKPLTPVLVLDQFEELFTHIRRKDPQLINDFVSQLADVVRARVPDDIRERAAAELVVKNLSDRRRSQLVAIAYGMPTPKVKVVIAIREDYLPELQSLRMSLPAIFRSAMRLEPLSRADAADAIVKPSKQGDMIRGGTFEYEPAAVTAMLDFLMRTATKDKIVEHEGVEPIQLQLLCEHVNNQRLKKSQRRNQVTVKDLGGENAMRRATARFYKRVQQRLPLLRLGWSGRRLVPSSTNWLLMHRPRRAMRNLCELGLIVGGRYRNSLNKEVIRLTYGVHERDLDVMERARLISQDPRLGGIFYELTHDSLVQPIRRVRNFRPWELAIRIGTVVAIALAAGWLLEVKEEYDYKQAAAEKTRQMEEAKKQVAERKRAEIAEQAKRVNRHDVRSEARAEEVRALSETDESVQLPSVDLSFLRLPEIHLKDADLTGANLTNSVLYGAHLLRARLPSAKLDSAMLAAADLNTTFLEGASLEGADLRYARLEDADLTEAKLNRADLRGASFSRARTQGIELEAANWWLASGWSDDDIRYFRGRWSLASYRRSQRYRDELSMHDSTVASARTKAERVSAYNSRAWFRATHGADLDPALADADIALRADPKNVNTMDTKGYLLLLAQRYEDAAKTLQTSIDPNQRVPNLGERLYHYALALERIRSPEASTYFERASVEGYVPTHELVLVPRLTAEAQ